MTYNVFGGTLNLTLLCSTLFDRPAIVADVFAAFNCHMLFFCESDLKSASTSRCQKKMHALKSSRFTSVTRQTTWVMAIFEHLEQKQKGLWLILYTLSYTFPHVFDSLVTNGA